MPSLVIVKNKIKGAKSALASAPSPSASSTPDRPAVVPQSSGKKKRKSTSAMLPAKKGKKGQQSIASFFLKGKKNPDPPSKSPKSPKERLPADVDKAALRDIVGCGQPKSDSEPGNCAPSPPPFKGVIPLPPQIPSPVRSGLLFCHRHQPTTASTDLHANRVAVGTDNGKAVDARALPNGAIQDCTDKGLSSTQQNAVALALPLPNSSTNNTSSKPPRAISGGSETAVILRNYQNIRQKYTNQFNKIASTGQHSFSCKPDTHLASTVSLNLSVQDQYTTALAAFVQDSSLPLSSLTEQAYQHLKSLFPSLHLTPDTVADKIKLIATREFYIATLPNETKPNLYEDNDSSRFWSWEVSVVDLLPDAAKVKKARSARRKIRNHTKAISKLLATLDTADSLLSDPETTPDVISGLATRISHEEDKILKFDRDAEKVRLQDEAKRQKEAAKLAAKAAKLANKNKENQNPLHPKKHKQSEEKRKALLLQQEKTKKQKARMMSFFVAPTPSKTKPTQTPTSFASSLRRTFHSETAVTNFRSNINIPVSRRRMPLFQKLSHTAKLSRRCVTDKVHVQVYVTVIPSNSLEEQPYADLKTISFPNKYKLFRFYEDRRPPYRGTWRKKSLKITGRTPFMKDESNLDYDLDSEAEWEEGEDDIGEDVDGEVNDDEDECFDAEGDTRKYNYQDGWLAEDDDFLYEDGERDQDTIELRREIMKDTDASVLVERRMCCMDEGGLPSQTICGVDPHADAELQTEALVLFDVDGDALEQAFDSAIFGECGGQSPKPNAAKPTKSVTTEIGPEKLHIFLKFVHRSTVPSKDALIEQLREAHPDVVNSKAQALRILDSVARKRRDKSLGGSLWLVCEAFLPDKDERGPPLPNGSEKSIESARVGASQKM